MTRNRRVAAGEYALLFGADTGGGAAGAANVRRNRVMAGLFLAGVVLLWLTVTGPLRREVATLRRDLPRREAAYAEMRSLFEAYQQLQVEDRALKTWVQQRPADFALFAHVTDVAQRQGLQLASLRPSARPINDEWQVERVKVELANVPLPTLVAFLHGLTAPSAVVRIDGFELRGGGTGLNVSFDAQTLTLRQ